MKTLLFGTVVISVVLGTMYSPASAGEADVVAVEVNRAAPGVWRFDVTVRHADAGWEHYADAWEILARISHHGQVRHGGYRTTG